jgi:hypothetical protein
VLALMWSPPVIEDLRHQPGNLTILRANFTQPGEDPVGLGGRAVQVWLADLDVSRVPQHDSSFDEAPQGSPVSGLVVMGAWLAAAAVTWPRRQAVPVLWRLHVVAALALLLGLLSVSRIFGPLSSYLLLWARGTTVVVLVATVWSGASAWSAGVLGRFPPRWGPVGGAAVLLAVVLGSTAGLTRAAVGAPVPSPDDSRVLAHLVPDTVDALRAGRARGTGPDGRYFVQWSDASAVAPEGYGLLLELERAGMEVSGQTGLAVNLVPHRARGAAGATATVTFVRGDDDIERWRADPDRVEVARYDPRTDGERARYRELRAEVDAELRRAGLDDVADLVRENLFVAMLSERFPPDLRPEVEEMVRLGQAAAVFVGPPTLDVPLFG